MVESPINAMRAYPLWLFTASSFERSPGMESLHHIPEHGVLLPVVLVKGEDPHPINISAKHAIDTKETNFIFV
jgi:hypothetical protein